MPNHWSSTEDLVGPLPSSIFASIGKYGRPPGNVDVSCQTYGWDSFEPDEEGYQSVEALAHEAQQKIVADSNLQDAVAAHSQELAEQLLHVARAPREVHGDSGSGSREVCSDLDDAGDFVVSAANTQGTSSFHGQSAAAGAEALVEERLRSVMDDVLKTVWRHTAVENKARLRDLSRHNAALRQKVHMLTHHMTDRSRQLSDCRYAYFLEITHLRNQVYIKARQGEEFQPTEAYFFDPTDFLDEELREMLNEKIRLSVKVYHDKLIEARRQIADLEARLDQVKTASQRGQAEADAEKQALRVPQTLELNPTLQKLCDKYEATAVVESLAQIAERALREWAEKLWHREGRDTFRGAETVGANARSVQCEAETEQNQSMAQTPTKKVDDLLEQNKFSIQKLVKRHERASQTAEVEKDIDANVVREHAEALAGLKEMHLKHEGSRAKFILPEYVAWAREKLNEQKMQLAEARDGGEESHQASQAREVAQKAEARALQLEEELERLRKRLRDLQQHCDQQSLELRELNERLFQFMEQQKPTHVHDRQQVGEGFHCADGRCERMTQTNLTAMGDGSFHLSEVPPTEAQLGIKLELEDLRSCAFGIWEATLEHIRASQLPPYGHGSGFCSRGSFLRLFQAAKQSLTRLDDLLAILEALKRAEIQHVIEGVKFLMESSLPDEDVALRDAIFGRGLNESAISSLTGAEFTTVARRIASRVGTIVRILFRSKDQIELGVHRGRRIFVPAGSFGHFYGGGSGGGTYARTVRDTSPPPQKVYAGVMLDEDGNVDEYPQVINEAEDRALRAIGGIPRKAARPTIYTIQLDPFDDLGLEDQCDVPSNAKPGRGGIVGGGYVTTRYGSASTQRPQTAPGGYWGSEHFPSAMHATNVPADANSDDVREPADVGVYRRLGGRVPTCNLSYNDVDLQPESRPLQPRRLSERLDVADLKTASEDPSRGRGCNFPPPPLLRQTLPQPRQVVGSAFDQSERDGITTETVPAHGSDNPRVVAPLSGASARAMNSPAKVSFAKPSREERPSTAPSAGRSSAPRLLQRGVVVARSCTMSAALAPVPKRSPSPQRAEVENPVEMEPQEEPSPTQALSSAEASANATRTRPLAQNGEAHAEHANASERHVQQKPQRRLSVRNLEAPASSLVTEQDATQSRSSGQRREALGAQQQRQRLRNQDSKQDASADIVAEKSGVSKVALAVAAAEQQTLRRSVSAGRVRPSSSHGLGQAQAHNQARSGRWLDTSGQASLAAPKMSLSRSLGSRSESGVPLMHIMSLPKAVARKAAMAC